VVAPSDIPLADLPDYYRSKLDSTVSTASIEDAHRLVTDLRVLAIQCQTTRLTGGTCGTSGP
jgi:protein phosphatase